MHILNEKGLPPSNLLSLSLSGKRLRFLPCGAEVQSGCSFEGPEAMLAHNNTTIACRISRQSALWLA
eukprot:131213-Lingulodinium_polyedra.AAC.1